MEQPNLLQEFVREECNSYVRALLEAALADTAPPVSELGLNRFDVRIDRARGVVVIEDITDASDEGSIEVPLTGLLEALKHEPVAGG